MKIVSLNVWGGRIHEPLMEFIEDNQDMDVFCLQEVYHDAHSKDDIWLDGTNFNTLSDLKKRLPNHICFYHPHLDDWWGLAMFIKKDIEVKEVGEEFVHKYKGYDIEKEKVGHTAKNIQYARLISDGKPMTIMNFHGLWNGKGKDDTDERIIQSQNIVEFIKRNPGNIVFCGDFNLLPDTRSIRLIEEEGLRNLIKEFGITSTRTSFYKKENKYADYAFVSPEIQVNAFKVLPDEVSDHAPLFLDLSL